MHLYKFSQRSCNHSNLGALADEVRPLDLTTRIVASGEHEPEFRGTKFINENKNNGRLSYSELLMKTSLKLLKVVLIVISLFISA